MGPEHRTMADENPKNYFEFDIGNYNNSKYRLNIILKENELLE